jgi:hypothetical protein
MGPLQLRECSLDILGRYTIPFDPNRVESTQSRRICPSEVVLPGVRVVPCGPYPVLTPLTYGNGISKRLEELGTSQVDDGHGKHKLASPSLAIISYVRRA